MKNKFTKLLTFGLVLFANGLLLTNCEKDNQNEDIINVEEQELSIIINHLSKESIEKKPNLFQN